MKAQPKEKCPVCKGKQIVEVWEADIHARIPVFCGTCNATGYADGKPLVSATPEKKT